MDIRVEENPAAVVAEMLAEAGDRGSQLVLTGGSTPKLAYEMASRAGANWSGSTIWFSDERCVPPESGLSNFRMANDALLGRINKDQRPLVVRMEGELGPDAGAASYEASVREHLGGRRAGTCCCSGSARTPTAPRCSRASRRSRSARGSWPGVALAGMEPQVPRITLTLPAFNGARRVVFLVTGKDKAKAVRAGLRRPTRPDPRRRRMCGRPRAS